MIWLYLGIAILTLLCVVFIASRRRRRHDDDIGDYYKDRTRL